MCFLFLGREEIPIVVKLFTKDEDKSAILVRERIRITHSLIIFFSFVFNDLCLYNSFVIVAYDG